MLLRLRVERVGALRALLQSPGAAALDPRLRERLRERTMWFSAFIEAHQQGRGRRVGRDELGRAGVSATFLDAAAELAASLGGDAAKLLAAFREGQLKRMRGKDIAENEVWFQNNGYLDPRPTLTDADVRLRVLGAAADPSRDAAKIVAFVGRWSDWAG